MFKGRFCCLMAFFVFCVCVAFPRISHAGPFKVLVVMSYDEEFGLSREVREGISTILSGQCTVTYFHMDTLKDVKNGKNKAKQAYALYQDLQPDGVIASDDNAQALFVIPYLKDKVGTPVIFCGVNAQADQYGYPSSNVTGILERAHFRESILFLQQLVPSIKTIGYLMRDNSTSKAFFRQAQNEKETYSAKSVAFRLANNQEQAVAMAAEMRSGCDALFIESLEGLSDKSGKPLTTPEIIPKIVRAFGKPTFCANRFIVESGVLCAVVKTGQEQGEIAAKMLLEAMQGTPVSQIPITQNRRGKAILNVIAMKSLGIKPSPMALHAVDLVRTKEH